MLKILISLFCVFITFSVSAETVYKKVNPDGSIEFTDTGSEDSEEVKIRKPTTYTPPRLPSMNQLPVKKLKPSFNYSLNVTSPKEDSVIINQPNVTVAVSLTPALAGNHKLRYELAGESKLSPASSVTFMNVPRGSHSIIISVVDQNGEVVGPIVSRNFHMKRYFKKPTAPQAKQAPKAPQAP